MGRSARCRSRPALWRSAARHLARPHAERAPAVFRMEPRTLPEPGSRDRSQHRGADHRRAGPAATSGAGVPHLPRHPAPLSRHRCRASGGDLRPRGRDRRAQLPERRLHPRASARDQDGDAHRGQLADPARQHPRFPLLPLRRTTLLQHPTIDRLRELGLEGMAKSLRELSGNPESKALDRMEWLGILLEHEMTLRQQKRFEARARTAKLRHLASVEDIDYRAARGLDRTLFLKLADCDWIREHRHCLLTGPCGVGKSWLACALGFKACRENLSVLYQRVPRLFTLLALGRGDGRYAKLMRQLGRVDLLILDDWGPEPLLPEQQLDQLEIVEDRYNAGSLIITSQLPVDRWYELVGNPTLADAILDRIIYNAYRVELSGESLRKPRAPA